MSFFRAFPVVRWVVVLGVFGMVLACAGSAFAAGPVWMITSQVAPRNLTPGGSGRLLVTVENVGGGEAKGAPIMIADRLPAGLTATSISAEPNGGFGVGKTQSGTEEDQLTCSPASLICEDTGALVPYAQIEMVIQVAVSGVPSAANEARVSGGGAALASTRDAMSVSGEPARFGVEALELLPVNEDGSPDTQAGSHPFELTNTVNFNLERSQEIVETPPPPHESLEAFSVVAPKDVRFSAPPGLVGNPNSVPQCTAEQFGTVVQGHIETSLNACPADTAVGVAALTLNTGRRTVNLKEAPITATVPLFNLVPNPGEPARFGFLASGVPVFLDTSVRTGGDYGVTVTVHDISQVLGTLSSRITFWGVPGAEAHDQSRGWNCLDNEQIGNGPCNPVGQRVLTPFLIMPTSCSNPSEPLTSTVEADSWAAPGAWQSLRYEWQDANGRPLALDGCDRLSFEPSITVAPDGQAASTPTGLTVGIHVPQGLNLVAAGTAESTVKDTTVALPAGVATDPSGADGLLSCTEMQVSLATAVFPACPEAAKIGTVYIKSPLLPNPLEGAVYLAAQNANPFGSLIAIYLVAEDHVSGVLVKLAGEVRLDPVTGQIVSTFRNTPQLPFEDLELHFFGGSRAPLTTPAYCGSYTTSASIAPWSGNAPATPSSTFNITTGPDGTPATCSHPLPFKPSLTAGSTNLQAGAFSPFTLTMSRADGNQDLQGIQLHMPPGLLGSIASVKLCEEPQAEQGTCGSESLIGHTVVTVGAGGTPFTVVGGKVYITGPYHGAPYGLSIVNPAKAGPFDLGQVIVRAAINIDPTTSALTVTSYPLPTIIQGIPLQIKHVNVTIDRPGFTFNPTNCNPMAITGTLASHEGASANLNVPFQVTNCATLAFKPKFLVSTSGHTSKANGASLDAKVINPPGPQGAEADFARVKVDLPKQLPSRLTTLQKACVAATFEANPASCPAASVIGIVRVKTPVLPVQLAGPVYFVSHGGEAFPSLVVVLQGDGVRVDLVAATFISKQGITSSTFKTAPDVPFNSFELYLPEGKFSALAANGNLCKSRLAMPTEFVAQNGASIHQTTKITVTGCNTKAGKARKTRKALKASHGHPHRRTGR